MPYKSIVRGQKALRGVLRPAHLRVVVVTHPAQHSITAV